MYWPFSVTKWNILCYCTAYEKSAITAFRRNRSRSISLQVICCYFCGLSRWPQHPPQSEIFFLKAVIVACLYAVAFQSHSEIFLPSCYCRLLSLLICMYWPSSTSTPCQSEIDLFSVIVTCSFVLAFQDQTPSQSEIDLFSVIVDCLYVLAFQDQTPSQSEIDLFSVIVDCLYVLAFQDQTPIHTNKLQ